MSNEEILALKKETGGLEFKENSKLLDLMIELWLFSSKWEWKKMIDSGAIFLNENKIEDLNFEFTKENLINWKVWLIRKWKKNFKIIYFL